MGSEREAVGDQGISSHPRARANVTVAPSAMPTIAPQVMLCLMATLACMVGTNRRLQPLHRTTRWLGRLRFVTCCTHQTHDWFPPRNRGIEDDVPQVSGSGTADSVGSRCAPSSVASSRRRSAACCSRCARLRPCWTAFWSACVCSAALRRALRAFPSLRICATPRDYPDRRGYRTIDRQVAQIGAGLAWRLAHRRPRRTRRDQSDPPRKPTPRLATPAIRTPLWAVERPMHTARWWRSSACGGHVFTNVSKAPEHG